MSKRGKNEMVVDSGTIYISRAAQERKRKETRRLIQSNIDKLERGTNSIQYQSQPWDKMFGIVRPTRGSGYKK